MAKFYCTCGEVMSNVEWPAAHEARLITDHDWDRVADYRDRPAHVPGDVRARKVVECSACGRLWVELRPGTNDYRSFKPEMEPLRLHQETSS